MVRWEEDLSIGKLIELSENEKIFLPEFQRSFVWDKSQIKLLIDSIYNNYTINSILFWEGGDELARRRVGGSLKEIKIPRGHQEKITYLLDGQQRATALLLVFTNKSVYRSKNVRKKEIINLYFDSEYKGDEPENRFIFDDEPIFIDDKETILKNFSEQELFSKFGTRFINLKDVYTDSIVKDRQFIFKKIGDERLRFDYSNKLRELEKGILDRKVYDIDQKGKLNQVLEVFERINTQNTKLNIFDIMIAKTYRELGNDKYFSLRDFLSIIQHKDMIYKDYLKNIESLDLDLVEYSLDEATLLFLIMIMLKRKFKQTIIFDLSADDFQNNLKFIHDTYFRVIQVLDRYKIENFDLSKFKPILKFLTAYLCEHKELNNEEEKFIGKWFWNTILYNRYPGAQNEKIEKDYKICIENSKEKAVQLYIKSRLRNFKSGDLDAYYNDKNQLYNGLYLVLLNNNPKDFYRGISVKEGVVASDRLEEHHIFPQNSEIGKVIKNNFKNSERSNIINNIANVTLITKETNNKHIGNKDPKKYILEFEEQYKKNGIYKEFLDIMKSQFIDETMIQMLKENRFKEFIEKRTELIKEKINQLCD